VWLLSVLNQTSSVGTPTSTTAIAAARRRQSPQNGARLHAMTARGTSWAAKAKRTVTNGARASGTSRSVACIETPPRLAEECSEAPRFDPS